MSKIKVPFTFDELKIRQYDNDDGEKKGDVSYLDRLLKEDSVYCEIKGFLKIENDEIYYIDDETFRVAFSCKEEKASIVYSWINKVLRGKDNGK